MKTSFLKAVLIFLLCGVMLACQLFAPSGDEQQSEGEIPATSMESLTSENTPELPSEPVGTALPEVLPTDSLPVEPVASIH